MGNEDWLWHYDNYRNDIVRELPQVKEVMGFSALRGFMHSMVYSANPQKLVQVLDDFLDIAAKNEIGIGFVFFDDCWNHAGLDLQKTCVPVKGAHNHCWMASPQDSERLSLGVNAFKPYVVDIIENFKNDGRVLWWEIFNEPHYRQQDQFPQGNFSEALRHSAYQWAMALKPSQPVISCWNEATDSDAAVPMRRFNSQLNDAHQYTVPWKGVKNAVFGNTSGLMQGGLVTEAGARWYQGQNHDFGSPLTLIDWLQKLRSNPAAPFVPGVMIDWEVMVSNSNTRWQWTAKAGDPEPAIPWHQHVFPDGSPVSYTEAAAIRRYVTGKDDFLYFEDFLNGQSNPDSNELFLTVQPNEEWSANFQLSDGLIELAVWPSNGSSVSLALRQGDLEGYAVVIDSAEQSLMLKRGGAVLRSFDASQLDNGILSSPLDAGASWNMLRVLLNGHEISIWLNPMYPEVFKDGRFPMPGEESVPIQAMPARIIYKDESLVPPGTVGISATQGGARVDYLSVLPPVAYGRSYGPDTIAIVV